MNHINSIRINHNVIFYHIKHIYQNQGNFISRWNERHLIAYFGTLMTLKLIVSIESRVSL